MCVVDPAVPFRLEELISVPWLLTGGPRLSPFLVTALG